MSVRNEEKSKIIVPLANFFSDEDLIKLDESLCIKRLESNEFEKLMKRTIGYYSVLKTALMDVEYVIEKKLDFVDSGTGSGFSFHLWKEDSPHMKNIVTALRLLIQGNVRTPTAFLLSSKSFYVSNTTPVTMYFVEPYFLSKEQVDGFLRLWKKLENVKREKPNLQFPINRFSRSFEEEYTENIIVDLMTAFESIVFRKGKAPRPYGRTIGIAIGMLIGESEKERTKIENDLKDAYDLRNNIVHGHLRKQTDGSIHEIDEESIDTVRDYLRIALKTLLEE